MRSRVTAWAAVVIVVAVGLLVVDRDTLASTAATRWRATRSPSLAALVAYTLAFVLRAEAWAPFLPVAVSLGRRVRALFAMLAVNHALPGPVGELAQGARRHRSGRADAPGPALGRRGPGRRRGVDRRCCCSSARWSAGELPALGPGGGAGRRGCCRSPPSPSPDGGARRSPARQVARSRRCGPSRRGPSSASCSSPSPVPPASSSRSPAALVATCAGVLAQVAAVLPGGVGTYEAGVTSALVVLGVPVGPALAVAASTHLVKFAYAFAVGIPALLVRDRLPLATTAVPA